MVGGPMHEGAHDTPIHAGVELSLVLPRDPASIPVARHVCQRALAELGCREEQVDDLGLVVTEACANVVGHTSPGAPYTVQVAVAAERCEMRVVDSTGAFEAAEAEASVRERALDIMSESGRGMAIMRALTDDFSLESGPGSGTVVRMVKHVDYEEAAPARRLLGGGR